MGRLLKKKVGVRTATRRAELQSDAIQFATSFMTGD
jgi:hypothetical protein